jgi:hypothetical protein
LTPFRTIEHTVKNDGKSAINRIALQDILGDDGKVIVKDKGLITEAEAKVMKDKVKAKEIEVRGFLGDNFDYFDAHQERKLNIAEANSKVDEF